MMFPMISTIPCIWLAYAVSLSSSAATFLLASSLVSTCEISSSILFFPCATSSLASSISLSIVSDTCSTRSITCWISSVLRSWDCTESAVSFVPFVTSSMDAFVFVTESSSVVIFSETVRISPIIFSEISSICSNIADTDSFSCVIAFIFASLFEMITFVAITINNANSNVNPIRISTFGRSCGVIMPFAAI